MINNLISNENVIKAENQLFSAQRSGNVDVLDQLLHDDLVAMAPTGQLLTKEMDLDSYRTKSVVIDDASIEIDSIHILDDVALSVVTMTAKGKSMGEPIEGKFRYFRVWKRIDGILKVVGASFIQLP